MILRPATTDDVGTILQFIRELAAYHDAPNAVVATDALLHDALFGPRAFVNAVIADDEGVPLGYALYFFNFSTWLGRPGVYVEELYVTPDARRRGIGRALLSHLASLAVERGCGRMEWAALDWNESAIHFYRATGAVPLDDSTVYRLTGDTLAQVATAVGS